jgi:hypothetical protein
MGREERLGEALEEEDPEYALHSYDDTFLECRDLRHHWTAQGVYQQGSEILRQLVCAQCGTERTDVWSPDGRVRYGGHYRYADGYHIGAGGVSQAMVRHEVVNRVTVYATKDEMLAALFTKKGAPRIRRVS